jgi:hypothetical protein
MNYLCGVGGVQILEFYSIQILILFQTSKKLKNAIDHNHFILLQMLESLAFEGISCNWD